MSCVVNKKKPSAFTLSGDLNIAEVGEVAPQLISAAASNDALSINLSGLTSLDTAGLQLLMLLKKAHPGIKLVKPSESVKQLTSLFQLRSLTTG